MLFYIYLFVSSSSFFFFFCFFYFVPICRYFLISRYSVVLSRVSRVCLCAYSILEFALLPVAFGYLLSKREFGVVRCPHTGPATCVFIPRGCTLRSWYDLYIIIWFHGGGGGRLVYNIHGILIADRSPEVRCSPLRFVMLSRQKWVVRCVALFYSRTMFQIY